MPDQIAARLDSLIEDVRKFHSGNMKSERPGDVVIVAHGKIFRAFAKRWVNLPLDDPLELMMAPGAVACLRYELCPMSCAASANGAKLLPSRYQSAGHTIGSLNSDGRGMMLDRVENSDQYCLIMNMNICRTVAVCTACCNARGLRGCEMVNKQSASPARLDT